VVLVHGFKGFKDWGFFPWVAGVLVQAGYAVISFNFSRNGIGTEPDRFTELDRFGTNTLSMEQEELRGVIAEALDGDLLPRRPRRLALLGHSRGGAQAILAAADESRIGALVTWGAVSHFDRWTEETKAEWRADGRVWILNQRTGEHMPLDVSLLHDFEANRDRLDVSGHAGRVGAPWLILHGSEDMTVWPGEASDLARANPHARLQVIHGAGHTFEATHPFRGPTLQLEQAMDYTVGYLHRHVEP
jgi:pimeloyl-ACP methyl ester carboxylesterase